MENCIFCKIIKGEIPSFKVYEDENVYAFEDINPISEGHTLVIPKRHAQDLWEIDAESLVAVHLASKKIMDAIKKALKPTGVVAMQLNGKSVGQAVFHYHLHLMPRYENTPPLPVARWEITPGNMDKIKETTEKIKAALR
ncbi:MAG: HIT family protein [Desulfatiglans sp.]|jgi:histidine triad (HIT) family protein|nr:HIT family protein [Desulfatiglans sp.]